MRDPWSVFVVLFVTCFIGFLLGDKVGDALSGAPGMSVTIDHDATVVSCRTADAPIAVATTSGKTARVTCVSVPDGGGR